ncbi:CDP-alcohol phosphatidyltransferase family protein [Serpentinicella sp. ANB-PHB4]|uniref:CDP-alcohol phosphatidyltransferase family protein n=1 Tax=Serpentinicella sp. ANB-PHB4 TaxID=3074076 RepID=UPI002861D059|nr:CDP-alcohol phosphatidyltransferase family protein [Serpentinicella sp. ANB-PHB4]MDR5659393.1 CDP-alcohol phosphatidyltransferase family protein [Serpentinicella sp. ANB-PHB4]
MNVPNILTSIRFGLVPIFIVVLFSSHPNNLRLSAYIFIIAGITDLLDGYIARKYNLITKWGQAMDPLADKLMQLAVLFGLTVKQLIPIWVIIILGLKELLMIFGGIILYTKGGKIVIPADKYGKAATIIFYIAILSIVFGFPYGKYLILMTVLLTLYAFTRYLLVGVNEMKKYKAS